MTALSVNTIEHAATGDRGARTAISRPKLGYLYVLSVPLTAGIAMLKDFGVGGVNYTGPLWMGLFMTAMVLLVVEKSLHRHQRIAFPVVPWLCWFGFVWLSLAWCERPGVRAIQDALQISMPLLIGMAASLFIRTPAQLESLLSAFAWMLVPLFACAAADKLGIFASLGTNYDPRVMGLTAVLIGCVYVTAWPQDTRNLVLRSAKGRSFAERKTTLKNLKPLAGWGACILFTVVTGSRMATLALLLVPLLHPGYRGLLRRGAVALVIGGIGVGLFYTPVFQRRFFYEGSGTLAELFQGQFLGFGRFTAWPLIWEEAWRSPVLGGGVGKAYHFVPTVWEEMTHAHNDYLRIGLELGLVGLSIFLAVLMWQIVDLRKHVRIAQGSLRHGYSAALLGLLVFMVVASTDNPLVYNLWFMNPLFALLGAAYGASSFNRAPAGSASRVAQP